MREHLVAYFEEHHKLVEAGALRLILTTPAPLDLSRRLIEVAGPDNAFVTIQMVERLLTDPGRRAGTASTAPERGAPRPSAVPAELYRMLQEGFVPPTAGLSPREAYDGLFASRFRALARHLKGRPELSGARPIAEVRKAEGTTSVIAMVREVRQTPEKHHLILQVEDETGSIEVLVPRDSAPAQVTFLPDEMVGLVLALPRERDRIPRAVSVHRPDIPPSRPVGRSTHPSRALFLSDLHIGSRSFLSEPWGALVDFLHGKSVRPELAREIHHVVIAGDLVDGIGIYPNQERDLAIGDVLEQYEELARRLRELPRRLNVVVHPGNHDAVCPAEPQPALPEEFRVKLPENVHSVGNPSTFALDGVVVESYHGRSFDDLIPAIPGASYSRPTEVMKRMLAMRHLAPMYGGRTPLSPSPRDGLVIDPGPDILVTGHAHTFGVDQYRGVRLLNASTWQAETEYQRMRNITPVPARAAVVDLTDLSVDDLDFLVGEGRPGGAAR
ncbi:MAG: metallophosphoesterase [Thermoplasmata archaeon]|nr:metallophosphoesterase [Thermoplasmata archaeon]